MIWEINAENLQEYLQKQGLIDATKVIRIKELGGGVSNLVYRVSGSGIDWVAKQSLPKLRVQHEWLAGRQRILRESAGMRLLNKLKISCQIPDVIFEDSDNFIIIISAAASQSINYKEALLSGNIDENIGQQLGRILAEVHRKTYHLAAAKSNFIDDDCFYQLRIEPYYEQIKRAHSEISGQVDLAIQQMQQRKLTLVHGDFSPKNILIHQQEIFLLDFEVVHYGDPAFDAAFFMNHLFLKAVYRANHSVQFLNLLKIFWSAYQADLPERDFQALEQNTVLQLGCLMLARIDGKSPAEYLQDADQKNFIRFAAKEILKRRVQQISEVCQIFEKI